MANPEHVALVRKGAKAIAEWRRKHPRARLDLSRADLSGTNLSGAGLSRTNLSGAILSGSILSDAILSGAMLSGAILTFADLSHASLSAADLSGANLSGAILIRADLSDTHLGAADLTWAGLNRADLSGAIVREADLTEAIFGRTSLGDIDFSQARGLRRVRHSAPSTVGVDTLIASVRGAGKLTPELETFFRGAGVPEELLKEVPRIVAGVKYYSCFISYGQPDLKFAEKLREDLKARGVDCWLYEMDKTVGKRTRQQAGLVRRGAEKMIVVCSADALVRDPVLEEIEDQTIEDPEKLMPVSLDDLWKHPGFRVIRGNNDLKPWLRDRNYADFAGWDSDPARYGKALAELLKGLRRP